MQNLRFASEICFNINVNTHNLLTFGFGGVKCVIYIIGELLSCSRLSRDCIEKDLHTISQKQVKLELRKILDKLAVNIIENNLGNEMLIQALLELARVERIIIVLHFLCGMELSEIAYLLETDLNSIYVQKCTAIKHLKNILS